MRSKRVFPLWLIMMLVLAACVPNSVSEGDLVQAENPIVQPIPTNTANQTTDEQEQIPTETFLPEQAPPRGAAVEFSTDFSKHTVNYDEILSGGPPKDGIPAIDRPRFVTVAEADAWLKPVEPVVIVEVGDDARAYQIQVLMWHEIANDTVGGLPLAVTFCPLCNTAIVFERTVDGQVLDFGTTGRLRFSNLIMYDRQTETWWQQASGEAIAGEQTGKRLAFYPGAIISWADFKAAHPDGQVLSRETGFSRAYGDNPYAGYDDVNRPPFLYQGPETPGVLPPVTRVLTVDLNGDAVAYPYDILEEERVINDTVGGQQVVVFWTEGTASALDAGSVAGGRDVGATNAYLRVVDDQALRFTVQDGQITDEETGSQWDILGQAISGDYAGKQLEPVIAINHFWFSWAAFRPDTRVYQP